MAEQQRDHRTGGARPLGSGTKDLRLLVESLGMLEGEALDQAIRQAMALKGTITTPLLAVLKRMAAQSDDELDLTDKIEEQRLHVVLLLLAAFREKAAFDTLIELCSKDAEIIESLFGLFGTEYLDKVLASVFTGDFGKLRGLIRNRQAHEYVRWASIGAYLVLYRNQVITRQDIVQTFRELFTELKDDESNILDGLVCDSLDIHPEELYPEIIEAYDAGRINHEYLTVTRENIEEEARKSKSQTLEEFKAKPQYFYIEDPVAL